jgi:hypothetical protein
VPDDAVTATLNGALYAVSGLPSEPVTSAPVDLRFEYRDSAGVHAVKEFHLQPSSYLVGFRSTVTEGDRPLKPAVLWGPAIGDVGEVSRYVAKAGGLLDQNGKVVRLAPADIAKQPEHDGELRLRRRRGQLLHDRRARHWSEQGDLSAGLDPAAGGLEAAAARARVRTDRARRARHAIRFFVGPKDFDVLSAIDPELALAINFGMFKVIVVPLLRSLKWVNGFAGATGAGRSFS